MFQGYVGIFIQNNEKTPDDQSLLPSIEVQLEMIWGTPAWEPHHGGGGWQGCIYIYIYI